MKIITSKKQHEIGLRLSALYSICIAMAKHLPPEDFVNYTDKYVEAIVDIICCIGGVEMAVEIQKAIFRKDTNVTTK